MRMFVCMYVWMGTYVHARSARPTGACALWHSEHIRVSIFDRFFTKSLRVHLILLLLIDKIKRDLQLCTGQTALFTLGGSVARVRERESDGE